MVRRNKLEILGGILNICNADGSSKTKIVYQVNSLRITIAKGATIPIK